MTKSVSRLILFSLTLLSVTRAAVSQPIVVAGSFGGPAISGQNNGIGNGIEGLVTGTGSFGVRGIAFPATDAGTAGVGGLGRGTNLKYGVLGETESTARDSAGVRGVDGSGEPSATPGFYSAGLRGESKDYIGVLGYSGGWIGVSGWANGVAGNAVWGVRGIADTGAINGSAGVRGRAKNRNAIVFGVEGKTDSTVDGAAGVLGIEGSGLPMRAETWPSSGVTGLSRKSPGVTGMSEYIGVVGRLLGPGGEWLSSGYLGWSQTYGVWAVGDVGATGIKQFVEPHPTDAKKVIHYVAMEGPEAGTYIRGRGQLEQGVARIPVPESFRIVTDEEGLTVQITPIGALATVAVLKLDLNEIVVQGSKDVAFSYLIQGVRRGYKDFQPITDGTEFVPASANDRLPAPLSQEAKRRLIANGTYNPDGTVNLETAARLGWTETWAEQEKRKVAAQKLRAEQETQSDDK